MYNGLLAFQYKTGDLSTITLGLGMTFRQMTHQAVNSVSGTEPQFKAMVMMALVGYDYGSNTVSPTPADAVSVVIVDPDTVNCLGDADYFITAGSPTGSPYSGLMAFQRKTGDLSTTTLGFGNVAEQMQNLAVSGAGGLDASFKSMLLISWVGYDYGSNTVSATPADAVSVTIEDPSTLNCLGDAAEFIGISGGGGGGLTPVVGSFTANFSNGIGAQNIEYYKLGNLVTLVFPLVTVGDPGPTTFTFDSGSTDLPPILRPIFTREQAGVVRNNGNTAAGSFTMSSGGLIQVSLLPQAPFTDNAIAGWVNQTITYLTTSV